MNSKKRLRFSNKIVEKSDPFERLPDDLLICILSKLSASSTCPSDFINALIACKRFNRLGLNQLVLSKAGSKLFSIRAKSWSESSHRFLKQCVIAGSMEACYFLGMMRFYCLENRGSGASLMAKAAIRSHAPALYSLAVIQFNGSGGAKTDKDLRAGVALCARAAYLGHIDALRELGHCLQDGYGVRQNIAEGRRLLVQANARELASVIPQVNLSSLSALLSGRHRHHNHHHDNNQGSSFLSQKREHVNQQTATCLCSGLNSGSGCGLLSDFGCNLPPPEPHPVNRFMVEWFALKSDELGPGLRMCSHMGCGRPETRPHEFRRCSVCGAVNYCSRGCQAYDWKLRHKGRCMPPEQWLNDGNNGGAIGQGEMVLAQGGGHEDVDS
ncbi:hypothetical protein Ancab_035602 [Ancistrocladus abbreviatus]